MNESTKNAFSYTYSAAQQEEIQKIRQKYLPANPEPINKMAQLRRLDHSVTQKGMIFSLSVGILGTLVMGFGMSLIMTNLGSLLGWMQPFVSGVLIGVLGMLGVIAAYPLYQYITKKERARVAPQILQLADELSQSSF